MLNGCVYYGDIHRNSQEINNTSLGIHHTYRSSQSSQSSQSSTTIGYPWWNRFNDPLLNQLITIALQDSPTIQIAKTRVQTAQYLTEAASSTLLPSIDLNGSIQRQRFSASGLIPPPFNGKTYNIGELGLNFNYEFDFWGKNRELIQSKMSIEQATQAELAESQLVLSTAVAETYFQLMNNTEQLKIAQEEVQVNNKLFQLIQDRMHHGIESDIPVQTLLANIQQAKQSAAYYKQATSISRNQLAVLLGKNPFTTDILTKSFSFHSYSISLPTSFPAHLLVNRPDITAAKLWAESAAHEVNIAKARFFPDINLSALLSYQSIELSNLFTAPNRNNAIMGVIDLPIFDAGLRRANLKVQYAQYDFAVNEYNQTILTALREVADQISLLNKVDAQLKAQTTSYSAIYHNYQLYFLRYQHGITDYTHILEMKNATLKQKAAQLELQTQYAKTVVALLKALGGKDV